GNATWSGYLPITARRSRASCRASRAFCSPARRPRRPASRPLFPLRSKVFTHRHTVFGETPNAAATAAWVMPFLTAATARRRRSSCASGESRRASRTTTPMRGNLSRHVCLTDQYDGLVSRVRMALAYYLPLLGAPGVEYHLHRTTLYNSIFIYDDEMLINL